MHVSSVFECMYRLSLNACIVCVWMHVFHWVRVSSVSECVYCLSLSACIVCLSADVGESPKHKQTWRGKISRTILGYGSGPILTAADVASHAETLGVIGVPLEFCAPSPFNEVGPSISDIHHQSRFIHSRYFYSASSSPLLLRGAPDYSIYTMSELTRRSTTGNYEWRTCPRFLHSKTLIKFFVSLELDLCWHWQVLSQVLFCTLWINSNLKSLGNSGGPLEIGHGWDSTALWGMAASFTYLLFILHEIQHLANCHDHPWFVSVDVALYKCWSDVFQLVPLLVSACTRIVEDKGLTNQGIYRVPGNTGSINLLIEEMNKVCLMIFVYWLTVTWEQNNRL